MFIAAGSGLVGGHLIVNYQDSDTLSTTLITDTVKQRIPGTAELVSINVPNKPSNQIMMRKKSHCLLPGRAMVDKSCRLRPSQIVEVSKDLELNYDDVVNMADITGLDTIKLKKEHSFTDVYPPCYATIQSCNSH